MRLLDRGQDRLDYRPGVRPTWPTTGPCWRLLNPFIDPEFWERVEDAFRHPSRSRSTRAWLPRALARSVKEYVREPIALCRLERALAMGDPPVGRSTAFELMRIRCRQVRRSPPGRATECRRVRHPSGLSSQLQGGRRAAQLDRRVPGCLWQFCATCARVRVVMLIPNEEIAGAYAADAAPNEIAEPLKHQVAHEEDAGTQAVERIAGALVIHLENAQFFQSTARVPIGRGAVTALHRRKSSSASDGVLGRVPRLANGLRDRSRQYRAGERRSRAAVPNDAPAVHSKADTKAIGLVRADATKGKDQDSQRIVAVWEPTLGEAGILSSRHVPGPYLSQEQRISDFGRWYHRHLMSL